MALALQLLSTPSSMVNLKPLFKPGPAYVSTRRIRHIWVEPNPVLPQPRGAPELLKALEMIFTAEAELSDAPETSQQYLDELRASLDDAGFRPVDERDLALSRALNSGYLLRLRVEPKLTGLDPRLGGQLGLLPPFPSSVAAAPGVKDQVWMQRWLRSVRRGQPPEAEASREELEVLSGGRVAVFVRGYGVEGLRSRMVLPKLNYLLE